MSDLIDKQALISRFEELKEKAENLSDAFYLDGAIAVIDTQPTAYDVETVVKRLEEARFILTFEDSNPMDEGWNNAIDRAIEIVQKGGKNE